MKQDMRNLWLDISLFIALLSAAFTGLYISYQAAALFPEPGRNLWLTIHVCSGLVFVAGSVTHVIWHRAWLKALRRRSIASLPHKLRANRVTDRLVWITFLATVVFGALRWMIPTSAGASGILSHLHGAFGLAMLLGNVAHLVLHSKWITSAVERQLQAVRAHAATIIQPGGARD
jgi:hypothetical protein